MSKVEEVAKMMAEAQTRQEIEDIFEEHCSQYKHSQLSTIARLVQEMVGQGFDSSLTKLLPASKTAKKQEPTKVHYGEYLLRIKARELRVKNDEKNEEELKDRRAKGTSKTPLDFMRLYDFATNFLVNGDWRAKTIAVRLFTGRRAGEILYRSVFTEYGEYAIKITYISKPPKEKESSSAVIPTLIAARKVIQLYDSLREEWHLALPQHWETYQNVLSEQGRMKAGETIKSNVQNDVVEFYNTSVQPLFPEINLEDDEKKKGAHSLRGVYGCLLFRLLGGHDNHKVAKDYMQKALIHSSPVTTDKYMDYSLCNFDAILEAHPELETMIREGEVGWIEEESMTSEYEISSLVNQVSDEGWKAKLLSASGSYTREELGEFLGKLIERGIQAEKMAATRAEIKPIDIKDATYKGSTKSPGAQKIQAIVDAIVMVNQKGMELAPTTPLIQEVHKRLYDGKTPNLATCRAVLNESQESVSQLPKHNRNIPGDTMETLIQEVLAQHGEPL